MLTRTKQGVPYLLPVHSWRLINLHLELLFLHLTRQTLDIVILNCPLRVVIACKM